MSTRNNYITFIVISLIALSAPTSASASWFISEPGILSYISSSILGDETQSTDMTVPIESSEPVVPKQTETPQSNSVSVNSNTQKSQEQARERAKQASEKIREQAKQNMEKNREETKKQVEIYIQAKKKLLESKKQTANFDLISQDATPGAEMDKPSMLIVREHIFNADGTIASESDKSVEGEDQIEINRPDGTIVKVSAKSAKKLEIMRDQVKVNTDMPVSINENNELVLTKKDGTTKILTILPDEAVGRLREKGLNVASDSAGIATSGPELSEINGQAVYKFSTDQEKKVFGIFRINLKRQVNVSTETGDVVSTNESAFTKLLNFLSF
ncbi:MAG: hypothetical protein WCL07_00625 [bacterium]